MKVILCPHLLLKFQSKICKFVVTRTCPKFVCCQKMRTNPLGVKMVGCILLILNYLLKVKEKTQLESLNWI